jgi:hypothetical protein
VDLDRDLSLKTGWKQWEDASSVDGECHATIEELVAYMAGASFVLRAFTRMGQEHHDGRIDDDDARRIVDAMDEDLREFANAYLDVARGLRKRMWKGR